MGSARLFVLFMMVFVSSTFATRCLQTPRSLGSGAKCGGSSVSCAYGLVCKTSGLCGEYSQVGEACGFENECVTGTSCIQGKCVTNLNPGESCNTTLSDIPVCGGSLSCDFLTGKCEGGRLGDSCTSNDDCALRLNCTSGVCTGAKSGESCFGTGSGTDSGCNIGLYCDSAATSPVCRPRLTSGVCTSSSQCQFGYACVGTTPSDDTQCVAFATRAVGEYCAFESRLCKDSGRCQGGYCAEKSPKFCSSSSECAYDESCTCSGSRINSGIGSCTKNKCYELVEVRDKCVDEKCGEYAINLDYTGSCAKKNCEAEILDFAKCNPAVRAIFSSLLLIAALLVVFF